MTAPSSRSSITAFTAVDPSSIPRPNPKPHALLSSAMSEIKRYCNVAVPLSSPPSEISDFPSSLGSFVGSNLTEDGEAMVRQAHDLSVLLELDTQSLMGNQDATSPQTLDALKKSASSNLANAMARAELLMSLMAALNKVAGHSFESLLGTKPACWLTTEIDSSCIQTLALAGVDVDSCINLEHLYQAITVRANELENLAIEVFLEGFQSKVRLNRLELASITVGFPQFPGHIE